MKWQFSKAILNYQRVYLKITISANRGLLRLKLSWQNHNMEASYNGSTTKSFMFFLVIFHEINHPATGVPPFHGQSLVVINK